MKTVFLFLYVSLSTGPIILPINENNFEKIEKDRFFTMKECEQELRHLGVQQNVQYLFADRGMRYGVYKCK